MFFYDFNPLVKIEFNLQYISINKDKDVNRTHPRRI